MRLNIGENTFVTPLKAPHTDTDLSRAWPSDTLSLSARTKHEQAGLDFSNMTKVIER